jgi:hypothetical protein
MTIRQFFSIPSVRFGVHVLIVVGVLINVYQLYRIDRIQQDLNKEKNILGILTQENNDARNDKDYFGSYLFKEKYAKDYQGFKIRGEDVIDTSLVEPDSNSSNTNYKPAEVKKTKSNWEKWWDVFFFSSINQNANGQ